VLTTILATTFCVHSTIALRMGKQLGSEGGEAITALQQTDSVPVVKWQ